MKRLMILLVAVVVLAGLCWAFPPLHIRSAKKVNEARLEAEFNPAEYVNKLWSEQLFKTTDRATDASQLLAAITASPQKAHEQFGHSVGLSTSYYYYIRGTGRVVSANENSVQLSVGAQGGEADVSIPLGLVFGNAIRDGSGLVDSSRFPNAQQYNAISEGLNKIVETQVLPELQRIAVVGKRIQFVGFVEVGDEDLDLKPLKVVPIMVKPD
jgi:predicted lipoprotein